MYNGVLAVIGVPTAIVIGWMFTTTVGNVALVTLMNYITKLFTGRTAINHGFDYLWNNPSAIPSTLLELLF